MKPGTPESGGADADPGHDRAGDLEVWRRLVEPECAELLCAVARIEPTEVADLARVRRRWPADLVAAAVELVRARTRAASKFPDADDLVLDTAGVEQATSRTTADHKAARYAGAGVTEITDLCCGIGGDAMSLARVAPVTVVDRSPRRTWMTVHNVAVAASRDAACTPITADVETMELGGGVFHLDPARRTETASGSRRRWRYEDYVPGPSFIERLLRRGRDGAIKLGPGVDLAQLPNAADREIECINERGTLVQIVLWCGRLANHAGRRTATRLPEGRSFTGMPGAPVADGGSGAIDAARPFDRQLLVVDPAIERAGLVGAWSASRPVWSAHPGVGLLTSTEPIDDPWITRFEVLAQMPWRPGRVRAWLAAHDAGVVEVKTRGRAVDTDAAQRDLRGDGGERYTVFGLRLGAKRIAVIARRAD